MLCEDIIINDRIYGDLWILFRGLWQIHSVDCGKIVPWIVDSAEEEVDGDGGGEHKKCDACFVGNRQARRPGCAGGRNETGF